MSSNQGNGLHARPVELLRQLLRFDTTNPPGNERACIEFIADTLSAYGIESTLYAKDPNRPNLVARLPGGDATPLLLYGHVDVVTTAGQDWQHPPFGGDLVDGWVWGRGALDMKGGVAMMLAAFLRARAESVELPGDVIFMALADEEVGGEAGALFMVEQHPEVFEGVRYAIGEFGGFSLETGGAQFYPIMIAEKVIAWLRLHVQGPGGHGAMPMRGGTMAKVARVLELLDQNRLPAHVPAATAAMVDGMATGLPDPHGAALRGLLDPATVDATLDAMGAAGRIYEPLLHNTVNATVIGGGGKINVVPSEVTIDLDGRTLPGYGPAELAAELTDLLGDLAEIEVLQHDPPGRPEPDMGLFATLTEVLHEADPEGHPVPLIMAGATDGRFFERLGVQTYGYLPMTLPADFDFTVYIHAADERIPAAAVEFGTDAIFSLLGRFGG